MFQLLTIDNRRPSWIGNIHTARVQTDVTIRVSRLKFVKVACCIIVLFHSLVITWALLLVRFVDCLMEVDAIL